MATANYRTGIRGIHDPGRWDSPTAFDLLHRSATQYPVVLVDDVSANVAYRVHVVDGVLATTGYCPSTYWNLDRLHFFVDSSGFQRSPESAGSLLHDTRRSVRYRLHATDLCGARCGRNWQSLGKLGQIGEGDAP